ncbi:aldehyde oxidase GLOX-like [Neltuma alba]|uniref:aldehyde oxidase GLOX-like n=1 Tax=Neltuma alba TaxID=207710 RepID=UPI0010A4C28F|nr:aldehyde oxidase GLOX-like [Prosopis alba]
MGFKKASLQIFFSSFYIISHAFLVPPATSSSPTAATNDSSEGGGHWVLLHRSIGISAMHMQVMRNNKVIIFDRTNFGPSNISLPNGHCRFNPRDMALKVDCTAHSVLYDIASNSLRPLTVQTDTWCSSAAVDPSGTLIQTGGFNDGYNKLRTFTPCDDDRCDWIELPVPLSNNRWYSSNQILPDGRIIIVGGRSAFTYEFVPKNSGNNNGSYYFRFLRETRDSGPGEENNLYPFLHLLPDGNLFIFANKRSVLFDYIRNRIVREYPVLPGDEKRNYPSTGSSVLLPLNLTGLEDTTRLPDAEVMVCGGAFPGSFPMAAKKRVFVEASRSCGRLRVTDPNPKWVIEVMPLPRVMPDMLILPTGDLIVLNGARNGTAGWENAVNPALNPVLYRPNEPNRDGRFEVLSPTNTARMYHSSAVLLPDGRILVGGSNPHRLYDFKAYPHPTDLSLEAYYPNYLDPKFSPLRPTIIAIEAANNRASYNGTFSVTLSLQEYHSARGITVSLVAPSFTTHSFAMNQRMLVLDVVVMERVAPHAYKVTARGPPSPNLAPPGYYMLYVVHAGIPSVAVWLQVN